MKKKHRTRNATLPIITVFINPFSDFGFKKIFTGKENSDLSVDFLNSLLKGETHIEAINLSPVERS